MTIEGVDFSFSRLSAAALKAAGKSFACRYLSYNTGKNLTAAEASALLRGGIAIVSNWESYGDWQHDLSGGYAKGVAHAQTALAQHKAAGGDPNAPIYFSVDFAPTAAQLPTIGDYFRGVASVIGLARTGAYGGLATIRYLFDHGLIRWGWQTLAWSGGVWDARAQLQQYAVNRTVAGAAVDLTRAVVANYGQWGGGATARTESAAVSSATTAAAATAATAATTEEEGVHVNLNAGERLVFTSNTVLGGAGWMQLSAAFGDCTVRVARYVNNGWVTDPGNDNLMVRDNGRHWSLKLDANTLKVTVENKGPGLLAVDTFADHPWT